MPAARAARRAAPDILNLMVFGMMSLLYFVVMILAAEGGGAWHPIACAM
jgi:hypothetical protein